MPQLWRCSQGHQWQMNATDGDTLVVPRCPDCGGPGVPAADGPEATLVAPARPAAPDVTLQRGPAAPTTQQPRPARPPAEADVTLQRGPEAPTRRDIPPAPEPPAPEPPAESTAFNETLQRPSRDTARAVPPREPPAGETLVRPPAPPTDGGAHRAKLTQPAAESIADETLLPTRKDDRPPARPAGPPPSGFDGYEILGVLGQGGAGVVYKARQVALNRVVALKMMRAGAAADDDDLARFRREAEAVAKLQHPNIVQIYEVGERGGSPFFSLEFVEGGSLEDRLDGTPMPPRVAADLLEILARAVEYAHERGIVHRDLKPGNILLQKNVLTGPSGLKDDPISSSHPAPPVDPVKNLIPKISDFGLAKRLQDSELDQTKTGSILGTPTYMAPEQAQGKIREIGPAADVYALGAIFYDLLTGRPPFRGSTVLDTLQMVQTQEPVPPKRLQPSLPLDLQTICLKCLEKEPAKRYASAAALADDLRRFLDGRPILARATTRVERVWKWAKRRPTAAALVVTSVLMLAAVVFGGAGLALANYSDRKAREAEALRKEADEQRVLADRQRDRAVEQEQIAQAERRRAQENFRQELRAVDNVLRRLGTDRLRFEPAAALLRRDLLEDSLRRHDRLKQLGDDPSLKAETAQVLAQVGSIRLEMGENEAAVAAFREAARAFEELKRDFPERKEEFLDGEAYVLSRHAEALLASPDLGNQPEAERMLVRAAELAAELNRRHPDGHHHRRQEAAAWTALGDLWQSQNKPREAGEVYARALDLLRDLARTNPDDELELARVEDSWGILLATSQHGDAAAEKFRSAVARLTPLAEAHPKRSDFALELGRAYTNYGTLLRDGRRWQEAGQVIDEAVRFFAKLAGRYRYEPDFAHLHALALYNRGMLERQTGQGPKAAKTEEQAAEILRGLAEDFPTVPAYREHRAWCLLEAALALASGPDSAATDGAFADAEELLRKLTKRYPTQPSFKGDLARLLHERGAVRGRKGRTKEAAADFEAAIQLRGELMKERPNDAGLRLSAARSWRNLGVAYADLKRDADEEKCYKESLLLLNGLLGKDADNPVYGEELGLVHTSYAELEESRRRWPDAARHWRVAAAERGKRAARQPEVAAWRMNQGFALSKCGLDLLQAGDPKQAAAVLGEALGAWREARRLDDGNANYRRSLAETWLLRAQALAEAKDHATAAAELGKLAKAGLDKKTVNFRAAGLLSRCMALATEDDSLPEAERGKAAEGYGDAALRLLRGAGALSAEEVQRLKEDKSFAALRTHPDFPKALAELDKK